MTNSLKPWSSRNESAMRPSPQLPSISFVNERSDSRFRPLTIARIAIIE